MSTHLLSLKVIFGRVLIFHQFCNIFLKSSRGEAAQPCWFDKKFSICWPDKKIFFSFFKWFLKSTVVHSLMIIGYIKDITQIIWNNIHVKKKIFPPWNYYTADNFNNPTWEPCWLDPVVACSLASSSWPSLSKKGKKKIIRSG